MWIYGGHGRGHRLALQNRAAARNVPLTVNLVLQLRLTDVTYVCSPAATWPVGAGTPGRSSTMVEGASRTGAGAVPVTLAIGTTSSCGKQVRSTVESAPFYGFGTATRDGMAKRFISVEHVNKANAPLTPGPGAYNHRVTTGKQPGMTTGKQPVTAQRSTASWKFGSQKRFDTAQKDRITMTPGPGAYLI